MTECKSPKAAASEIVGRMLLDADASISFLSCQHECLNADAVIIEFLRSDFAIFIMIKRQTIDPSRGAGILSLVALEEIIV